VTTTQLFAKRIRAAAIKRAKACCELAALYQEARQHLTREEKAELRRLLIRDVPEPISRRTDH
jgi:hypothetical protein